MAGTALAIAWLGAGAAWWWSASGAHATAIDPRWTATVVVLAGDGVPGRRDGDASRARFSDPFGVAVAPDGTVYVADAGDAPAIRAIAPDGRVSTLAGGERGFTDGLGSAARFDTPSGLAIDSNGVLYVADTGNHAIRRVTPEGHVSTVAGDGVAGDRDGPARAARFNGPIGIAVSRDSRLIVADTYNDRIRTIELDGTVRTLAGGSTPGAVDGIGPDARFDTPCGVAVDNDGVVHVADTGNGLLRAIEPSGLVRTLPWPGIADEVRPISIAFGSEGDRFVTDAYGRVHAISRTGEARTLAGSTPGFRDGRGLEARFRAPAGIAWAAKGRLVVADEGNAIVRIVAAPQALTSLRPSSPLIAPEFDAERFGWQPLLWPVAPIEGPHEIAGTLGEARGVEGAGRFHAGVDVRAEHGTLVYAVRDGTVTGALETDAFGTLNEWLRVGPISYVHIRVGRTRHGDVLDPGRFVATPDERGRVARVRVRRGTRFSAGDVIGTVNPFNHVHVNVGWPGEEVNPLRFRLPQFADRIAPTIARGGIRLFDDAGRPLTARVDGRVIVSGRVQVVVDAWDRADGNRPNRRLGLYALGYQVLDGTGAPAPGFETVRYTMRFDRLAIDPDAAGLVFAPGSGIPFYGRRRTRFLYAVTNTLEHGRAARDLWDTTMLPPGPYTLRIWAADIRGNVATANRDLAVAIVPPGEAAAIQ